MSKFWIIMSHTYMSRIKTKSFIISTLITLLFIVAATNFQTIIDAFSDGENDQFAVIDESGELYEPLQQGIQAANEEID
ncbi:ABC transporter permease, partial [Halomonas sp. MG34]|nr:ABC transporter permease [Halomonas sp. MG34]